MTDGSIFNIQRFCINDGPGIRTTVFMKGCPLHCLWCHNPESQKSQPELLFSKEKCVLCNKCSFVCKNGVHLIKEVHSLMRDRCTVCGECEKVCSYNALEIAGKHTSADEIISTVLKDKIFYDDSDGGMTLSGGEPFFQYAFMLEILKKAKKNGIHTCVETCGFTDKEKLLEAAEYIDIFLYDWKITDPALHKKYTGTDNKRIHDNLRYLNENGSKIILRCPVIPGVNDSEDHFRGIARLANSLDNIVRFDLSPYHELGLSKLSRLGKEAEEDFSAPDSDTVNDYLSILRKYTDTPVKLM